MPRTLAALLLLLAASPAVADGEKAPEVAETTHAIAWRFAGLKQLPAARAAARERRTRVLVGLSGSDT